MLSRSKGIFKALIVLVLKVFPESICNDLIYFLYGKNAPKLLIDMGKRGTAIKYVTDRLIDKSFKYNRGPAIIVGGLARTGKTILSDIIAKKYYYFKIDLDEYRYLWNDKALCSADRIDLKVLFLERLIRKAACGLVFEGDQLVTHEITESLNEIIPIELDIRVVHSLVMNMDSIALMVGCAESDPFTKRDAILAAAKSKPCWAADRLDNGELLNLSQVIVQQSRQLKALASLVNIPYFEIDSAAFDSSFAYILSWLDQRVMKRNPSPP